MNPDQSKTTCSDCGTELDETREIPRELCPECGSTARTISVTVTENIELSDGTSWQHAQEFYEQNRLIQAVVIVLSMSSFVVGLISGPLFIALSAIFAVGAYFLSPKAVMKIRKITTGQ